METKYTETTGKVENLSIVNQKLEETLRVKLRHLTEVLHRLMLCVYADLIKNLIRKVSNMAIVYIIQME